MSLISTIKDLIIYKEPKPEHIFELYEDENEDAGTTGSINKPAAPTSPPINEKQNASRTVSKTVFKELSRNLQTIKNELNYPKNKDAVIREFVISKQYKAFIVYIDGMADKDLINDYVLRQLMTGQYNHDIKIAKNVNIDYFINNLIVTSNQITKKSEYSEIIADVLNGLTAIFIDGFDECIMLESRGYEKRSIMPPTSEVVIDGPEEAFVENLKTNLTMIRRIIRNKDLITEILPLGKVDNRNCAILYIKGICNPKIVQEVKRRIESIDFDYIAGDGVLMQLIEDHPFSLFPQVLSTERPDRTAYFLISGSAAIICAGYPYAILAPVVISDLFHTSEDLSLRWQYGSFLRIIRHVAAFLACFSPSIFLALTLYHQKMIPTELLASFAKARENVPFPTIIELLALEVVFELIREAGLRVPGVIGQTLGIIGAVVLGQAAVAAGFTSPSMIIIASITGMCSFAIPNYYLAFGIRLLRFVFIFFGAIAGFYGISVGLLILLSMLCSMKSFGVPFLAPIAPKTKTQHDIIIRGPTWTFRNRPDFLNTQNRPKSKGNIRGWKQPSSNINKGKDK